MTRQEEIKELESALRTITNPFRDYDLELEARIMIDDGWHKQIEATWKLNKDGSGTCSTCKFTQRGVWDYDNFQKYCGCCGAKMRLEEK